ncbi:hypothetical protein CBF34_07835 [Vagococcus penaei]|uniref:Uncharacterized protein n=1 Tax=Vagococcus penaei TaxID=633807 RepID=A0A1Q2D4E9_9ENTE|nr:energy-coupling factor transporter transmembrane component T [Vagococcus penaei]AQP53199.1 hypothetical protein BW732_02420 [Vagococcus penaei]RSU01001.1 hypothetical protein CBF34_07835 [Vagococcus penaei]
MKKKQVIAFDPRSKLVTVFVASLLLMLRVNWQVELSFVLCLSVLLGLNGGLRKASWLLTMYLTLLLINRIVLTTITGPITAFLAFLLVAYQLLLPPVMASAFAANQTATSEWIAALKKARVPNFILIPFIVVCRFFPTLMADVKRIRQAMILRGIATSNLSLFKQPLNTLEYLIVPILMSVENTSLDLSAAALVRGLGNKGTHTSVYVIKFGWSDYLLICIMGLFVGLGVYYR